MISSEILYETVGEKLQPPAPHDLEFVGNLSM